MELLVMTLVSNAKEMYLSKECMQRTVKEAVKQTLKEGLEQNKISSTDHKKALDILEKYEIMADQVLP